ncbi:MAG: ribosome maturation factor RimM [Gallionella sp.]
MGRVAAAHGIRGWVKVQPYTEYLDSLQGFSSWWLGNESGPWSEVKVANCEVHNKTLAAQFPECTDRTAAERLKGLLIAVPRSGLPEQSEGEYYWVDLIGLDVVNEQGEHLGKVDHLLETGANQVLSVLVDSRELLIPFVASVIKQVDIQGHLISVDWSADN